MFGKKKKSGKEDKIILGMILIKDENSFNLKGFFDDLKYHYNIEIRDPNGDNTSLVFTVGDEFVMIGHIAAPIPLEDIQESAYYAYNWQTALEDSKPHKSHLIVSIMKGSPGLVNRFETFTRIICSLLRTTNSIGVYKGNQSLLIPKDDYLNEASLMDDDNLPLNLWIYFGLRTTDSGKSGYTYGLKEFDKSELEIINSSNNLEDIREFLYNISHYILSGDITFKDGQTCGVSEDERIPITFSKGKFVEGDSYKLGY